MSTVIGTRELSDCELALVSGGANLALVGGENEEIRNNRAMSTAAFQAFDETASELMNLLSSVVKTVNGMRGGRSGF